MGAPAKTTKKDVKGIQKINKHFKDVKVEMRKVHWPTRKELTVFTVIVLISIASVGVFFWFLDTGFNALLRLVIQ
ncbi:MAG: preprotein translocase subunit SecE [Candidatus Contubernalis sp.]|nr:preprotein translocase subunit SecE [Candidatus Contubernalis sp.]